jgi:hypothetical protein
MIRAVLAVVVLAALAMPASAEPSTVYRNDKGQITGYATKQGNTTVFTDAMGRQTGRAVRSRDGTTIIYDAMGRQIGTARRR